MNMTPSTPPRRASVPIWAIEGLNPQRKRAGIVNMTPDAREEAAEPVVWAMFVSRMPTFPHRPRVTRKKATAMTASGIDVEIVRPTRRPR